MEFIINISSSTETYLKEKKISIKGALSKLQCLFVSSKLSIPIPFSSLFYTAFSVNTPVTFFDHTVTQRITIQY